MNNKLLKILTLMLLVVIGAEAATPFTCDDTFYNSYRDDNNKTVFHQINRNILPYQNEVIGTPSDIKYNAMGYNVQDNLIYSVSLNNLIQIDKDGNIENLGVIGGGYPNQQIYAGEFDRNGIYYVFDHTTNIVSLTCTHTSTDALQDVPSTAEPP